MRVIASSEGRRRIWYRDDEIEQITADELEQAGLMPSPPATRVDIETFVEQHLGAVLDYGAELPANILGFTEFTQPPRIGVNRDLTDAACRAGAPLGIIGRWRATLAHEAAHVLFHGPLYAPVEIQPGRPNAMPIRCSRLGVEGARPRSDWREVQANKGMAALLMPKALIEPRATAMFERRGRVVPPVPTDHEAVDTILNLLAIAFEVSRQAARLRLTALGFVES